MQISLDGRNALVTGGSLGLGRAIAAEFCEAGANVAIVARRQEILDEAATAIGSSGNGRVVTFAADVGSAKGCIDAFRAAERAFGKVDILVNNAGTSATAAFEDISDDDWQHDFDLKLFAAIRLSRLALPGMKQRRFGRIINTLNTGAKAPPGGGAPTVVTRAAGMALTKVLANEGAAHNVLVNAMLVGRIRSDQWAQRAVSDGVEIEDYYDKMGRQLPMGRLGTEEEFASLACLLASDRGGYITGTAINVDGGLCPVV